jgi:cytochrome c-type biogenesis protein CcmH
MTFWIAAVFLALVVAGLMLLALRRRMPTGPAAGDYDLRVYRDQLGEVDRDLARGVIPPRRRSDCAPRSRAGYWRPTEARRGARTAGTSTPRAPRWPCWRW